MDDSTCCSGGSGTVRRRPHVSKGIGETSAGTSGPLKASTAASMAFLSSSAAEPPSSIMPAVCSLLSSIELEEGDCDTAAGDWICRSSVMS
ncbi:hypothetical protein OUZ56_014032 [Daphnia magna]|uniref:Uncharacterized protein n=1 Tax=Daphnia magna TaxID=35525 RepID=A0ABQ9Z7N7_9CRUS|nr:hypothetical protein OUZ56_014032 [Daphnia magna]